MLAPSDSHSFPTRRSSDLARFKSFSSKAEAEAAFKAASETQTTKSSRPLPNKKIDNQQTQYIQDSISVDAACSGNPGAMEYRARSEEHTSELQSRFDLVCR